MLDNIELNQNLCYAKGKCMVNKHIPGIIINLFGYKCNNVKYNAKLCMNEQNCIIEC